jgi:hypothetical protein
MPYGLPAALEKPRAAVVGTEALLAYAGKVP